MPLLVGQPIDASKKSLGQPSRESQISPGVMQSTWERDAVTLSANWKSSSKRVISFELISRDASRALREGETDQLLVPGQLKPGDPRYSTEWIEAADRPLYYIGVRVVPTPQNHAVVIRITGPVALLQVAYEATSSSGKNETFVTIPPWETSLTLSDDATVAVSASVTKVLGKAPLPLKAEIIVDGKVVASSTSQGNGVQCRYEL